MKEKRLPFVFIYTYLIVRDSLCDIQSQERRAPLSASKAVTFDQEVQFPAEYLTADVQEPNEADLNMYVHALYRIGENQAAEPNDTDPSRALGSFFAQGVLTRTLLDYGARLDARQRDHMRYILSRFDYYLQHFIYSRRRMKRRYIFMEEDAGINMSEMYGADQKLFVQSLPKFSRDELKPWLLNRSSTDLNSFTAAMDAVALSRGDYIHEVMESLQHNKYHIHVNESDRCLAHLMLTLSPAVDDVTLRPCRPDHRCAAALRKTPSIAYSLSHSQLQYLMPLVTRRCYRLGPLEDVLRLRALCAAMLREAVFIARRGFFARDIFVEHVALCGLVGYEEFYRRRWFLKVVRWVDADGCVREASNFIRRRYLYERNLCPPGNKKCIKRVKYWYRKALVRQCDPHLQAVTVVLLSNAVHHAARHLPRRKAQ